MAGFTRRFGITNRDRLQTVDDASMEAVVSNLLIPMVNMYNEYNKLDWRGRFCSNSDEGLIQFELPDTTRLQELGPHEIPRYMGAKYGTFQEFSKKWGDAIGYDTTFIQYAKKQDYVDKMKKGIERDVRTIRYEFLKEILNPQSLGRGFYNKTFDSNGGITAPPTVGVTAFTAAHNHYNTSGAATISNLDIFADMKQHIREHGFNSGPFTCIMNSSDIVQLEKLAAWVGTSRANISNPATNQVATGGIEDEFNWMGINFISEDFVPAGYIIMVRETGDKVAKFIEPSNAQFRGLLWMEGKNPTWPIVDSYLFHQFNIRTWNRGVGVVYQITASSPYSAPSDYA